MLDTAGVLHHLLEIGELEIAASERGKVGDVSGGIVELAAFNSSSMAEGSRESMARRAMSSSERDR